MGKNGKSVTEKKRDRQEAFAKETIERIAKTNGEHTLSERGLKAEEQLGSLSVLPSVVVFDIDDTLWCGDVDLTTGPPWKQEGRGLPVFAAKSGHGDKLIPFPDVPEVMDWLEIQGIKVAVCTHTSRPSWATGVFDILTTTAGTSYTDVLAIPIDLKVKTKDKDVHLRELATKLECPCDDMIFFDDKEHNVRCGRKAGCTSVCTPQGLTWDLFVQCCAQHEEKKTGNPECAGAALLEAMGVPKAAEQPGPTLPKALVSPPQGLTPGFARLGAIRPTVAASGGATVTPAAKPAAWKPAPAMRPQMMAQANMANMWGPMTMFNMMQAAQFGSWGPY